MFDSEQRREVTITQCGEMGIKWVFAQKKGGASGVSGSQHPVARSLGNFWNFCPISSLEKSKFLPVRPKNATCQAIMARYWSQFGMGLLNATANRFLALASGRPIGLPCAPCTASMRAETMK